MNLQDRFRPGISLIATLAISGFLGLGIPSAAHAQAAVDLFVSCNDNAIRRLAPDGTISLFASGNGLLSPEGIVFDSQANLFAANFVGTISKITPNGTVNTFASGSGLTPPLFGLAIDSSDNLFAASPFPFGSGTLSRIMPTGSANIWVSSGLYGPEGLAVDREGNLYAANNFAHNGDYTVSKITPDGVISTFASGLSSPTGLAFDSSDNLYIGNRGTSSILKITQEGEVSIVASDSRLNGVFGLVVDQNNALYAASTSANVILRITPDGQVTTFGNILPSAPHFLALGPTTTTATPEPSSLVFLTSMAVAGAVFLRKRRRK